MTWGFACLGCDPTVTLDSFSDPKLWTPTDNTDLHRLSDYPSGALFQRKATGTRRELT